MFTAVIHEEDGIFIAECPEVGSVSQGTSMEEALLNLREATSLYLKEFPQTPHKHPFVTTFDMAHA
jgi:predicted RNase H-like HicB family nuclease